MGGNLQDMSGYELEPLREETGGGTRKQVEREFLEIPSSQAGIAAVDDGQHPGAGGVTAIGRGKFPLGMAFSEPKSFLLRRSPRPRASSDWATRPRSSSPCDSGLEPPGLLTDHGVRGKPGGTRRVAARGTSTIDQSPGDHSRLVGPHRRTARDDPSDQPESRGRKPDNLRLSERWLPEFWLSECRLSERWLPKF